MNEISKQLGPELAVAFIGCGMYKYPRVIALGLKLGLNQQLLDHYIPWLMIIYDV